jgi:hypothetical protein
VRSRWGLVGGRRDQTAIHVACVPTILRCYLYPDELRVGRVGVSMRRCVRISSDRLQCAVREEKIWTTLAKSEWLTEGNK